MPGATDVQDARMPRVLVEKCACIFGISDAHGWTNAASGRFRLPAFRDTCASMHVAGFAGEAAVHGGHML